MQAEQTHAWMCTHAKQAEVEGRLSEEEKEDGGDVEGCVEQICAALPLDTGCRNKAIGRKGRER